MAWEQLLGMIQEARDIDAQEASEAPVVCPNDYTTLVSGPDGTLHCPWDGFQYPRDA